MNAREALKQLEERHGYLTPALVVEEARPVDSELHGYIFDRTPADAAEAWWLHQAQDLIQSIRVRYESGNGEPVSIRRYVSVMTPQRGRVYQDCEKVGVDPIARELVLREMARDMEQMKQRYEKYQEFWDAVKMLATSTTS